MKIIETKYRGYHFRSRLEARWAVFFDEIGLPFFPFKIHHDLFDTGAEFLQCRRCECIAISKVESGGEVMASY